MLKTKVVAAIDFGTHATGYAWAVLGPQNDDAARRNIRINLQWKSQPAPYPKNLTALLLDESGEAVTWGYDARKQYNAHRHPGARYLQSFKMRLLNPTQDPKRETSTIPLSDSQADEHRARHDETSELISTYLRFVYSLAFDEISSAGFHADEIRWCITVPAIWDDYQRQAMRQAAVAAGMPADEKRLILAVEPEAAAHYARVSGLRTAGATGGRRPNLFSPGTRFLLVDCGGGTVDITAYKTSKSGKLIEIGNDHGGPFGSEYINRYIVDKVFSSRLGSYDLLADVIEQAPRAFLDMLEAWERAKLDVSVEVEEAHIPIPSAVDRLLSDQDKSRLGAMQHGITDQIVVTGEEVREGFESVIPGLLELVDRQLAEMRTVYSGPQNQEVLVLVGGFARSSYLQVRLREHVDGRASVLVPTSPEVAVLSGAAHFAYDPQTRARRTRFTYGVAMSLPFREGVDPPESAFRDDDNIKLCSGRFQVFVRAGDIVEVGHDESSSSIPVYDDQKALTIALYRARSRTPRYITDPGCEKIGEIRIDLSSVMHLPRKDRAIHETMIFGQAEIGVAARVARTNQAVQTTVNFDPA